MISKKRIGGILFCMGLIGYSLMMLLGTAMTISIFDALLSEYSFVLFGSVAASTALATVHTGNKPRKPKSQVQTSVSSVPPEPVGTETWRKYIAVNNGYAVINAGCEVDGFKILERPCFLWAPKKTVPSVPTDSEQKVEQKAEEELFAPA